MMCAYSLSTNKLYLPTKFHVSTVHVWIVRYMEEACKKMMKNSGSGHFLLHPPPIFNQI